MTRELDKCRTATNDLDNKMDDKTSVLESQLNATRRSLQDKASKNHNNVLEKNAIAMS